MEVKLGRDELAMLNTSSDIKLLLPYRHDGHPVATAQVEASPHGPVRRQTRPLQEEEDGWYGDNGKGTNEQRNKKEDDGSQPGPHDPVQNT